jgi:hypothetical protein
MAQKLYMEIAAHPQAILDAMDEMRGALEQIERQQKWITPINTLRWVFIIGGFIMIFFLQNVLIPLLLISIAILSFFVYRPRRITAKLRFDAAYQVIHTLRDDTGRKGRLIGHLDLSAPNQKTKLFRTALTSSGRTKSYYRDPWFVARLKLVDGNVVKLLLEDRIKDKRGIFVYHHTNFESKVMINPEIYEAVDRYDPTRQSVIVNSGWFDAKQLEVQSILDSLKATYATIRTVEIEPGGMLPTVEVDPSDIQSPESPAGDQAGTNSSGAQPA